jgi:hypothetical protein
MSAEHAQPASYGAAGDSPNSRTSGAAQARLEAIDRLAETIAERLEERLDERQRARAGWVTAAVVAEHLGVEADWVYEHADELGGIRLGDGPKARRRFKLATVDEALTACQTVRTPRTRASGTAEPKRRRRRQGSPAPSAPLLPVRRDRDG